MLNFTFRAYLLGLRGQTYLGLCVCLCVCASVCIIMHVMCARVGGTGSH